MKIKKTMVAILAMSSVAGLAHADVALINNDQAHVEFYGILDAAVGEVQHSLSVDPQFPASVNPVNAVPQAGTKFTNVPSSVTGLFNGGISDSRFGFKGSADLGNDFKGFFTLESGINVTTGRLNNAAGYLASNGGPAGSATTAGANSSLDGQLFSRQAFVGLSYANLGSVALGRNYAPIYDIVKDYDPVQNAQLFSPFGFSGTYGGGGGVSEDTRVDNSLKYSNKIGPFNFGALYKFGGIAGATSAQSAFALNAGYEVGNLGVQAAYETFNDALKGSLGAVANTVAVTNYDTKAFMIAAKYKFNDAATAKIGYETYTLNTPSEALNTLLPGSVNYYGQAVNAVTNFSGSPQTTDIYFIGGDYNFTEKFNLAAGLYDIHLEQSADYALTASSITGQGSGDQRYLSLLADYHFTKTLDTYAGAMFSHFSGNNFASTAKATYYTSNNIVAVGVRYKF